MARPFIVLGDRTDHGGEVVEASAMTDTHGKRIARVGDKVTCPKRNHGPTTIVTGDPTMIIDGKPVARHGDKCACGATLIASQYVSFTDDGSGSSSSAHAGSSAAFGSSEQEEEQIAEQYFALLDENDQPVAGYRYDLFKNGLLHTRAGGFDSGSTAVVAGEAELRIVAWLNGADRHA
jgi:uncharacterized Zn-binding protein involved in type VI secretion